MKFEWSKGQHLTVTLDSGSYAKFRWSVDRPWCYKSEFVPEDLMRQEDLLRVMWIEADVEYENIHSKHEGEVYPLTYTRD